MCLKMTFISKFWPETKKKKMKNGIMAVNMLRMKNFVCVCVCVIHIAVDVCTDTLNKCVYE